eukprot:TRINITY_DN61642_c0_g1_i2.p1 TRINITY_DN61642_c0_g1~~TRINITY_DN61642_c0_g1_i2.p1  ORF type:complete len:268 (+),score=91.15 TRINITY_DN61642_c0_g1_i2:175-978(+)
MRAKMHALVHDQIVCLILEIVSNLLTQLEASLVESEKAALHASPICTSKIANSLNGAMLCFRFRRYGVDKFGYLLELATQQMGWQLSGVYGDSARGAEEARAMIEQALLPSLRSKIDMLEDMVMAAPVVQQLASGSGIGAALVQLVRGQIRQNSDVFKAYIEQNVSNLLDMSTVLAQLQEVEEGAAAYNREDIASTIADKLEANLESACEALNDEVANQIYDIADFLDCLLYTSDAADEEDSVDLGGRRIIKKKKNKIPDKQIYSIE